jgi:xanthine dehydrogenase accessory factor
MRDIISDLNAWVNAGEPFAIATVLATWGSGPRKPGAVMAINSQGEIRGSVSAGCVENAVIAEAAAVLHDGERRLLEYGVSDETAWSVGLTCGGSLSVGLSRHMAFEGSRGAGCWADLSLRLENREAVVLVSPLAGDREHLLVSPGGEVTGDWDDDTATEAAVAAALIAYAARASSVAEVAGTPCFLHVFPRPDQLVIVGAAHITLPLVALAAELDFESIVIDPRTVFTDPLRFPVVPDEIIGEWPDTALPDLGVSEDTYAVVLSHDPKIDDPALRFLLNSPVPYIGALGSRRTHARRLERLRDAGFGDGELERIHAPIGLDIGARTPAEIALSIMAEVVAAKYQREPTADA